MNVRKIILSTFSLFFILGLIYPLSFYFGFLLKILPFVIALFIGIIVLTIVVIVSRNHYQWVYLPVWLAMYYVVVLLSFVYLLITFSQNLFINIKLIITFAPAILFIYLVTFISNFIHERLKGVKNSRWYRPFVISFLPLVVILFPYLSVASIFNISIEEIKTLLSIGLAITYFNLGATLFSGSTPLDLGIVLPDGERLLGEGKSLRGATGGLLVSLITGTIAGGRIIYGIIVGLSTLIGDVIASFIKRRFHIARGEQVLFLDQFDSIMILLILENAFQPIGLSSEQKIILAIATLIVQIYGNICLFLLGKKNVQW
jgi:CDP-2,3-bis-(O-geranylgeranyl)-sn-glycerol synthase